jgi:hypothetical protein
VVIPPLGSLDPATIRTLQALNVVGAPVYDCKSFTLQIVSGLAAGAPLCALQPRVACEEPVESYRRFASGPGTGWPSKFWRWCSECPPRPGHPARMPKGHRHTASCARLSPSLPDGTTRAAAFGRLFATAGLALRSTVHSALQSNRTVSNAPLTASYLRSASY